MQERSTHLYMSSPNRSIITVDIHPVSDNGFTNTIVRLGWGGLIVTNETVSILMDMLARVNPSVQEVGHGRI